MKSGNWDKKVAVKNEIVEMEKQICTKKSFTFFIFLLVYEIRGDT